MNGIGLSPVGRLAGTQFTDKLLDELRQLVADLGKDGGLISPSVYDTAQVLRFYPPKESVEPALEWLLAQQQPDGGWGDAAFPIARLVPTLAAILAIDKYSSHCARKEVLAAGWQYLMHSRDSWPEQLPENLPVGIELIFPQLILDAQEAELFNIDSLVDGGHFSQLFQLGVKRRRLIERLSPGAGSPSVFSWEAWGDVPRPHWIDSSGSIGHSPAATARWLNYMGKSEAYPEQKYAARQYLLHANQALLEDIPGIYPTAWPIDRFEQSFGLHALLLTGCLLHPKLADVVSKQLLSLKNAFTPTGIGFSEHFETDGDDSFAAASVLISGGYEVNSSLFQYYRRDHQFTSYPYELQSSPSVTARAVHALTLAGGDAHRSLDYLVRSQQTDGRWTGDKWNCSWLYTTAIALSSLEGHGCNCAAERSLSLLLEKQQAEGGWSSRGKPSLTETAYGVIALMSLLRSGIRQELITHALESALTWMWAEFANVNSFDDELFWLNKELYRPYRIDRLFVLGSMFAADECMEQPAKMLFHELS